MGPVLSLPNFIEEALRLIQVVHHSSRPNPPQHGATPGLRTEGISIRIRMFAEPLRPLAGHPSQVRVGLS